jgi:hypothetical protein
MSLRVIIIDRAAWVKKYANKIALADDIAECAKSTRLSTRGRDRRCRAVAADG